MIQRVLNAATVSLRDIASWAGVSYETARSWRIGRRHPSLGAQWQLTAALRKHARRLERFADRLERRAERS